MRTESSESARLPFWKFEATGNDFVFVVGNPAKDFDSDFVVRTCAYHTGIGADGLVFLFQKGTAPDAWQWRFFNRDGSETALCGNAARCVGRWLSTEVDPTSSEWKWQGTLGTFTAKRAGEDMSVRWPHAISAAKGDAVGIRAIADEMQMKTARISFHQVGVPHLVIETPAEVAPETRARLSPILRHHPLLGTEGANVTWMETSAKKTVTFERGVEGETLSCGSGAVAAHLALGAARTTLIFPGGPLTVSAEKSEIWLSGPARCVFKGELSS